MFGPLSFPSKNEKIDLFSNNESPKPTVCVLCEDEFVLPRQETIFLQHLLLNHSLIISDVNKIVSLNKYLEYWKERFKNTKLQDFGAENFIEANKMKYTDACCIGNDDVVFNILSKGEKVFVLSDNLKEDKTLRENLQTKRLEYVLEQQRIERESNSYRKDCLFCHTEVIGTTTDYLNHLSGKHNLLLGKPQNLVFVEQLINTIEFKLANLQCLYCEKVFKDRNVLKEHMRKKLHKRINPKNTEYDRFYIVNYLQIGRKLKHLENVRENESPDSDEGSDSDWSDWREDTPLQIVCLFCKSNSVTWEDVLNHMKVEHNFDYEACTSDMDFYQQVKLVNYIRRQIHRSSCIICEFSTSSDNYIILLEHMKNESHFILPDKSLWDQPEYFFPTYENDLFLSHIDDPAKTETSSLSDVNCS